MDKKKILIIDDETDLCVSTKIGLELSGDFSVTTAENGKDGIALARKIKPDVVLLDLNMPMMDGLEVLKALKKDKQTFMIPVLMFSVVQDEKIKIKAAQLYDEEYITKDIPLPELKIKIDEVLKRIGK